MSENVSNQEVETPCVCGRKSTTDRPRYGVDPVIFKSNCHCTFWQNFWNSCFVSGTHAIPCYTWFVLVSYGFFGFQCKLWMGVLEKPASSCTAENSQGLQNVLMKLAVLELWRHPAQPLPIGFAVVFCCSLMFFFFGEFWRIMGIPKKMQLGYSNRTHVKSCQHVKCKTTSFAALTLCLLRHPTRIWRKFHLSLPGLPASGTSTKQLRCQVNGVRRLHEVFLADEVPNLYSSTVVF